MVHFVLQTGSEKLVALLLADLALIVEIAYTAARRTLDFLIEIGDGEAAFLVDRRFIRGPDDFRIHEKARLRLLAVTGKIHDNDLLRYADLDRGKPDARRSVHGLQHVVHQGTQLVVHPIGGFGDLLQPGVGGGDDFAYGHGPQISPGRKPVKPACP